MSVEHKANLRGDEKQPDGRISGRGLLEVASSLPYGAIYIGPLEAACALIGIVGGAILLGDRISRLKKEPVRQRALTEVIPKFLAQETISSEDALTVARAIGDLDLGNPSDRIVADSALKRLNQQR